MLSFIPNLRVVRASASAGFMLLCTATLVLFVPLFTQEPTGSLPTVLQAANERFGDAPFVIAASGACFLAGTIMEQLSQATFSKLRQRFHLGRDAVITFEEDQVDWNGSRLRKSLDFFSDKGALDLGSAIYQYAQEASTPSDEPDSDPSLPSEFFDQTTMKLPTFIVKDITEGGFDAVLLMKGKELSERRSQLNAEASLRETILFTALPCLLAIAIRFGASPTEWLIAAGAVTLLAIPLVSQANRSRQEANDIIAAAMRADLLEIPPYPVFR